MNESKPERNFLESYIAPSGAWGSIDRAGLPVDIDNPKLNNPPEYIHSVISNKDHRNLPEINEQDFNSYADQLVDASIDIIKSAPDVVLVPMRGGIRLWQHLHVLCGFPFDFGLLLPFTGVEKYSETPRNEIVKKLTSLHIKEQLRIVCVDAADGGQGSSRMIDILEELHSTHPNSEWKLTFCLFVAPKRQFAQWQHAHNRRAKQRFYVDTKLYVVPNVIGEDMQSALICAENFGSSGKFITTVHGEKVIINSTQLPGVIDRKITEALHDALRTEPHTELRKVY